MALEKLRLDGEPPSIILLDINMPGISGWTFLDQLNQLNRKVAVYMYSSSIDPDDMRKVRQYAVVKDFLPKPLDNKTIRRLVDDQRGWRKVS
jgi:CheY-like chemotaxis protein